MHSTAPSAAHQHAPLTPTPLPAHPLPTPPARPLQGLLTAISQDLPRFDMVNLATAVHQLGSCRYDKQQMAVLKGHGSYRGLLAAVRE
jgi:hypothetical protein